MFGEEGDADWFVGGGVVVVGVVGVGDGVGLRGEDRGGRAIGFDRCRGLDGRLRTRWCRSCSCGCSAECSNRRGSLSDLPITLFLKLANPVLQSTTARAAYAYAYASQRTSSEEQRLVYEFTHPKELSKDRVIRLARLPLDVLEVLCEPKAQDFEHAVECVVRVADGGEGFGAVEVCPVLEVGSGFEELCGEGEAHGGDVFDADESGGGVGEQVYSLEEVGLGGRRKGRGEEGEM